MVEWEVKVMEVVVQKDYRSREGMLGGGKELKVSEMKEKDKEDK